MEVHAMRWGIFHGCLIGIASQFAIGAAHASPDLAAVHCAHDATEFTTFLSDASNGGTSNGHDNVIHLVAGTFATNGNAFTFNSSSGYALSIDGGYDFNCVSQDLTPGKTILDGGGPPPNGTPVLSLQSSGDIDVSRLTIRNGYRQGSDGGGATIYLATATAVATFDNNQVLDNYSDYAVGGLTIFGTGIVHIDGNLFAGNQAPAAAAVLLSMNAGSMIDFNSNTIAGNVNTNPSNTAIIALGGGSAGGSVSNNITAGNAASYDFYLYSSGTFLFVDNDYHSLSGIPAANGQGNLDLNPQFVNAAAGNYRLTAASPLHAKGAAGATGGLPAADLDGHPFPLKGKVDMGAWNDILFADGFDG